MAGEVREVRDLVAGFDDLQGVIGAITTKAAEDPRCGGCNRRLVNNRKCNNKGCPY